MAAGADTLEELLEIYKALIIALDKAGIQIKASKVEFGVEEITFHNYRVIGGDGPMANTTTPKKKTKPLTLFEAARYHNQSPNSRRFWAPPNRWPNTCPITR